MGLTGWMHNYTYTPLFLGLMLLPLTMICWWRDVIRESTFLGYHTSFVTSGLRMGMVLFIISEICFFFGFFWAFFHSSLAPSPEIGCSWPPAGITPLNPFAVPLLNTAILLASGISVTWAHHSLLNGNRCYTVMSLFITCILGAYFTLLQAMEYYDAPFTIADSVYGSIFFVATGFHGLHVIIGTIFLTTNLFRTYAYHFTPQGHFGFEAGAWYWHFVDVVWIFLYLSIYWWGS
uniref:Cytochrome c oxidase subunit 3 n=1 Tax=Phyllochaetopterus sp. AW-2015 TaxID=1750699 RepID=A0A0S2N0J0_9ANNE|nr:cytochrome c oxidase subunit III [Phyllochaetopterus sp. AW-2015]